MQPLYISFVESVWCVRYQERHNVHIKSKLTPFTLLAYITSFVLTKSSVHASLQKTSHALWRMTFFINPLKKETLAPLTTLQNCVLVLLIFGSSWQKPQNRPSNLSFAVKAAFI